MDLIYNILMILVAVVGLPFFAYRFLRERRFRERLRHNFGFFSPETLAKVAGLKPVWFQAASVGEVVAASSIIKEFKRQMPEIPVLISSGTTSGYEMAQRILPEADAVIFYPPDLPWLPGRIVNRIPPAGLCAGGDRTVAQFSQGRPQAKHPGRDGERPHR